MKLPLYLLPGMTELGRKEGRKEGNILGEGCFGKGIG